VDRVDGHLKVTGAARYAAEFQVPCMVYAGLVQSTIAAGAIAAFDLDAARAMPGVLEIITPGNALKLSLQGGVGQTVKAPLLQDTIVHYNGQHITVVIADTLDRALDAAARVRVHYHMTEAATEMSAVMDRAYPPRQFRNGTRPPDSHRGDAGAAFATVRPRSKRPTSRRWSITIRWNPTRLLRAGMAIG
jgi:xanthine dehydrogenase YagR molybdenum-binding subunit